MTGTPEWCEEHATRILTDFEIGTCKKLYLLFLYSFDHPDGSEQARVYIERAAMLAAFYSDISTEVIDQLFDHAYADAGKA